MIKSLILLVTLIVGQGAVIALGFYFFGSRSGPGDGRARFSMPFTGPRVQGFDPGADTEILNQLLITIIAVAGFSAVIYWEFTALTARFPGLVAHLN